MEDEIKILNNQIKNLSARKAEYQRVSRELNGVIDDFEGMKKSISKAQGYLKEGDTGKETLKQIAEMNDDIKDVNSVIGSLEEMQKETSKEIRAIDNEINEKEKQINRLNIEKEENNKKQ